MLELKNCLRRIFSMSILMNNSPETVFITTATALDNKSRVYLGKITQKQECVLSINCF